MTVGTAGKKERKYINVLTHAWSTKLYSFVVLYETIILNLISQNLDIFYQIQMNCYHVHLMRTVAIRNPHSRSKRGQSKAYYLVCCHLCLPTVNLFSPAGALLLRICSSWAPRGTATAMRSHPNARIAMLACLLSAMGARGSRQRQEMGEVRGEHEKMRRKACVSHCLW
jgi:hypothetical protein